MASSSLQFQKNIIITDYEYNKQLRLNQIKIIFILCFNFIYSTIGLAEFIDHI
jgi:hypothetical protein